MTYPDNTIDTVHSVIVTNDLIQIVHVETCKWGIENINISHDDYIQLDLNSK